MNSDFNIPEVAMVCVRAWQHLLNESLKKSAFRIPVHLAFGYEAIAVALSKAMTSADRVVLHHRNIAYQLAFRGELKSIFCEFLGKKEGAAGGRLGSMNLAPKDSQIAYTTSILGNGLPVATGIALHQKDHAPGSAVFVTVGDGAIEEGACYESLVFARSHNLPLIVILENNDQSMSSTIAERRCPIHWQTVTKGIGIPFKQANGVFYDQCAKALSDARSDSVEHSLPVFVEVSLRAFNQHAGPSPGWPGDTKTIDIQDGAFLRPLDEDPLSKLKKISPAEIEGLFSEAIRDWQKLKLS